MATVRISGAGAAVVIESTRMSVPVRRTLAECVAMLSENSTATIDAEFAGDVAAAVEAHREPLDAAAWD